MNKKTQDNKKVVKTSTQTQVKPINATEVIDRYYRTRYEMYKDEVNAFYGRK